MSAESDRETKKWTETAALLVTSISQGLAARGWTISVVSIARRVDLSDGTVIAPGSSILSVEEGMEPALPGEASNLRKMADDLDKLFRESGAKEAESGFIEEIFSPFHKPQRGA